MNEVFIIVKALLYQNNTNYFGSANVIFKMVKFMLYTKRVWDFFIKYKIKIKSEQIPLKIIKLTCTSSITGSRSILVN